MKARLKCANLKSESPVRNLNLRIQCSVFDSFRDIQIFDSFRDIRNHILRFFKFVGVRVGVALC